jgi:uncharacterized membrane protein YphA (DoxX/SURF4 family)
MDVLVLVGRLLFALVFLEASLSHITQTASLAGYARSRDVRSATRLTLLSGVGILAGGLSVALGIWADLGALILVVFLLATSVGIHSFWKDEGQARLQVRMQFQKDLALAGAALAMFGLIQIAGDDLGLTLTGPLL